jgi:hypothetical protein
MPVNAETVRERVRRIIREDLREVVTIIDSRMVAEEYARQHGDDDRARALAEDELARAFDPVRRAAEHPARRARAWPWAVFGCSRQKRGGTR